MIILVIVKSDKDSSQIVTGQLSSLEGSFILAVQIAALPGKKMYFSEICPKEVQTQLNRDLPSSLPSFYSFSPSLGRNSNSCSSCLLSQMLKLKIGATTGSQRVFFSAFFDRQQQAEQTKYKIALMHTFNLSTWEMETGGSLSSEASQSYIVRLCFQKKSTRYSGVPSVGDLLLCLLSMTCSC